MTKTEALTSVKFRINIDTTDFDSELGEFFTSSVDRLYPLAQKEVDAQEVSIAVDSYGEASTTLSDAGLTDVRAVEVYGGGAWRDVDNIFRHGTKLRVRGLSTSDSQLRLYGLSRYVVASDSVDLPAELREPVFWFMASFFFDMLAGNKSKYNTYMQTNGGNAVDDMRAEADYYEQRALQYLENQPQIYGA